MEPELSGKRCIVTGSSRGIGQAAAIALANAGARVVLVGRDEHALQAVQSTLQGTDQHLVVTADLAEADSAVRIVKEADAAWGGVDLLVNNAASSKFGEFDSIADQDWEDAFRLKLLGYVRMARAVLPSMRRGHSGCIINVVGVAGRVATPGYSLGAINAAVLHWTRSLAETVACDGVRVLALNPGATRTERLEQALRTKAAHDGVSESALTRQYASAIPLGRFGEAEEVGQMICAMAGPLFRFATGSSVFLDGGSARGDF